MRVRWRAEVHNLPLKVRAGVSLGVRWLGEEDREEEEYLVGRAPAGAGTGPVAGACRVPAGGNVGHGARGPAEVLEPWGRASL